MNKDYNALIKCDWVSSIDTHNFQINKIYEVKNGKLIDGHGRASYSTYSCIEEINESFYAHFREVK